MNARTRKFKDIILRQNNIYLLLFLLSAILLTDSAFIINNKIRKKADHYIPIMSSITASGNRSRFNNHFFTRKMDYIELLEWVGEHMTWVPSNTTFTRYTDPMKILENGTGQGRCGEHSYVYAAACASQGYDVRIVVSFLTGDHVWVEVLDNGKWIHVDPSPPQRINEPSAYANKFDFLVLAFQSDGKTIYLWEKYNPIFVGLIFYSIVMALAWRVTFNSISVKAESPSVQTSCARLEKV